MDPCTTFILKALAIAENSIWCFQRARKFFFFKFLMFSFAVEVSTRDWAAWTAGWEWYSAFTSHTQHSFSKFQNNQYGFLYLHYTYGSPQPLKHIPLYQRWDSYSALCSYDSSQLCLSFTPPLSHFTFLIYLFGRITLNPEPFLYHSSLGQAHYPPKSFSVLSCKFKDKSLAPHPRPAPTFKICH